jgi:organic hydroperoxide reductase OsmC/OhrA
MATYTATITWARGADEAFTDDRYSRAHDWAFDGGVRIRGSSSPHVVPRFSDPAAVDPEEALVAALSSCHMLTFLHLAAKAGHVIERYEDTAQGVMARRPDGRFWVSRVTLRPQIDWGPGGAPSPEAEDGLHHAAHEECFIANSVLTEVVCEPIR